MLSCTPHRSLRAKRGRLVAGCLVACAGGMAMLLSGPWRNDLIAPGPLSAHHAHLLGDSGAAARCAQCHAQGSASFAEWAKLAATAAPPRTQTELCGACHDKTISPEFSLAAHSLPLEELTRSHATPTNRAREPIACSACHREHQGRNHNLSAIDNTACQACHAERYESFAQDHPDFGVWPYERRTPIVFDHQSHASKHHPAAKRPFACTACHDGDSTDESQLTRPYAESCAECHDRALTVSLDSGVPVLALPTLELEAWETRPAALEAWPSEADGDFDGAIPNLAKLLIAASPEGAAALATLGPTFEFFDVDPDHPEQLAAAAALAAELKGLVDELAERGEGAIARRLAALLDRPLSPHETAVLAANLSRDVAAAYRARWFSAAGTGDVAAPQAPALGPGPGAGWSRHEATLSLRFHPTGHADPWMTAWLDALAEAATGPRAAVAEPLLRAALKPTAPGGCGSCHSVERSALGELTMQWRPRSPAERRSRLTHFAHGAHLVQAGLRDCTACHRMAEPIAAAAPGYATDNPLQFVAGFAPLSKSACLPCHTPKSAGDACTQCHRYHAGSAAGNAAAAARTAAPLELVP
ncbi:MAG TPA: hypothetical protein VEQ85_13680 [Lacipirellulaceae bacterium]|nr:hypothetical protein [Lacipirellulaceae bacterium]